MTYSKSFIVRMLCFSVLCIFVSACGDDDEAPTPGTISLTPASASYEGVRGTDVELKVTASAEDGIKSLVAKPEVGNERTYTIADGTTTSEIDFTFSIPGDATLGTSYNVTFELTDDNDQTSSLDVGIAASKLLVTDPATYDFQRNGSTTVSFSGQTDRLNQLDEIKAYLKKGDGGDPVSAAVLRDALANTNDNGNGFFSFTSDRQLGSKMFQPDVDDKLFDNIFVDAEAASMTGMTAADGTAGLITRENSGKTVLVDANGREFTQLIEKGLMGAVFYNQIYNVYLTGARIGNDVENTALRDGSNYTDMEHHWDEAYGYFEPPVDFTSPWPDAREPELRYWANYSNVVDPFLNTNAAVMDALIAGRAAIVNNDPTTRDAQRDILYDRLEVVTAATAVHYINLTLGYLNENKTGEAFHALSEAWAFTNALRYNPNRRIDLTAIAEIMDTDFGADGNFWNVTVTGLNKAKSTLVTTFPEMDPVKDQL